MHIADDGAEDSSVKGESMKNIVLRALVSALLVAAALVTFPERALSSTIWPDSKVPQIIDSGPDSAVELGVKFKTDTSGTVSAIRFYKADTNTGIHMANLWSSGGERLATATFTNETGSGWQEVQFTTPVAISPNTVYVASYHTSSGHYSCDQNYFAGQGVDNPPLYALANGISGLNGVYAYGATSSFPISGWNSSNYWVDVVFNSSTSGGGSATGASIWPSTAVPEKLDAGADDPVELGVKFRSDTNGSISGIRFYKSPGNNGSHTGRLWNSNGTLLATAAFAGETASGWQQADFPAPVPISANVVYIASYHTATGNYSYNYNYFNGSGVDVPPLHVPADGVSGANGVFSYGPAGSFPTTGWKASNYWVDVVFTSDGSVPPVTGVEPAGWYAGDMHVHRSCGGSPEALTTLYQKMAVNNLYVISLLADMGNGEVLDPVLDLPRVNGYDEPSSTAGRIMHWDAEWHWDPIYEEYSHHALGGHVVALGLSEAHQIKGEYTFPVFQWTHQQNGIAGFAHMQYLDNDIPQNLTCCTPLEYPVEVALGQSDFISEDMMDINSSYDGMCPDCAVQAYYRLLNCGFRPGFAAGTDYPCNSNSPLGSLLTYVRLGGEGFTYRSWIEGIAQGRTVVSRNGHNEFLDIKIDGSAGPGDEIKKASLGSVQVTVQWTASQDLEGTIELIKNGAVVGSKVTTVAPGAPQSLSMTVDMPKSGWLAARRMGVKGHYVHTGAVFVTVNDLPVRASVTDADFYVRWMDNLLEKTSLGGPWSSFFSTSRSEAQGRYLAARSMYQQIAIEAAGTPQQAGTIFTTQTPTVFGNDSRYELGTRFSSDVGGQITHVRIYTNAEEGGSHTVRIWRAADSTVVSGPFTWNFSSGSAGWKTFALPQPLTISANNEYIVAVSNSSDQYYAAQLHGLDFPLVNGHLKTSAGSGVWSDAMGSMPTNVWQNTNYFRDVIFVPQP